METFLFLGIAVVAIGIGIMLIFQVRQLRALSRVVARMRNRY